jgi:hypothetical protein
MPIVLRGAARTGLPTLTLSLISIACLGGCGHPVCVVGVGDCDRMFRSDPGNPVGGSGLSMNPQPNPSYLSTVVTLNVTGGYGKLSFSFDPGGCGFVDPQFHFHASQVGRCSVQVMDSYRPPQTFTATLNIRSNPTGN